ncbi:DinB family protein [Litorihabitans aurantiacus]|nr:DinB family protein [Litorihabitans aurantiacus]
MTIDAQGRQDPPLQAGEVETLLGFLEFHRATLAWKTADLDAVGLSATTAASGLTLGGLLKHLACVEENWFSYRFAGRPPAEPWASADWEADPDWELTSAASDTPEELRALWSASIDASRAIVAEALADGGPQALDTLERRKSADDGAVNLRWILVHMIEEYSRHNGHADLLREAVDGLRGE